MKVAGFLGLLVSWEEEVTWISKTCILCFQVPQKFHKSSAEKEKLRLQRVRHFH